MMSLFLKIVFLYFINVVYSQNDQGDQNVHSGGFKFGYKGKPFSLSQKKCPGGVFFEKPIEIDWICVDGYFIKRSSGCVSAGEEIIGAMDYVCRDYNQTKEKVQAFISITEQERSNEHGITFFDDKNTLSNMRIYNLAWGLQKTYKTDSEVGSPYVIVVNPHKTPEYQVGRYCYQGVNKMDGAAFRFNFPNEDFGSAGAPSKYGFMKKPCKPDSIKLKFSDGEKISVLQGTPPLPGTRFTENKEAMEPIGDTGDNDDYGNDPSDGKSSRNSNKPAPNQPTNIDDDGYDYYNYVYKCNEAGCETNTPIPPTVTLPPTPISSSEPTIDPTTTKSPFVPTTPDSGIVEETTNFAPNKTIIDFMNSTDDIIEQMSTTLGPVVPDSNDTVTPPPIPTGPPDNDTSIITTVDQQWTTRFIYPIKLKHHVALGSHINFLDPFLEEEIDLATYSMEAFENPDKKYIELPTTWWYGILKESVAVVQKLIPNVLINNDFFTDVLQAFSFMFRIIEDDDVDLMTQSEYDTINTLLQKCKADVPEAKINFTGCPFVFRYIDGMENGMAKQLTFGHEPPGPNKFNSESNDIIIESVWNVVDIVYSACFESFATDLNKHSRMITYLIETVFRYDRVQARWYRTPEGLKVYQALIPYGNLEVLMYNYDKLKAVSRQGHAVKDWLPKPRKVTKFHTRKEYVWENEIVIPAKKEAFRQQNRWIRYKQHKTVNVYEQSNKRYEKEDWAGKRYKRSMDKPGELAPRNKRQTPSSPALAEIKKTVIEEWKNDFTAYCLGYGRNVIGSSSPIGLQPSLQMLQSQSMC